MADGMGSGYGKSAETLFLWIGEGEPLLYADKEKGRVWIDKQTGSHSRRLFDIKHDLLSGPLLGVYVYAWEAISHIRKVPSRTLSVDR